MRASADRSTGGSTRTTTESSTWTTTGPETDATTRSCPECSGSIHREGTERICAECGLVVATDRIDRGPEWRTFDEEGADDRRCKGPRDHAHHAYGLGTRLGASVDGRGKKIAGGKRKRLGRLRKHNTREQFECKAERNLAYVFGEIKRITGQLGLPKSARDRACRIAREAQGEELYHGQDLDRIAPASVYAACRVMGITRSVETVAEVARADAEGIEHVYGVFNVQLGLPAAVVAPSDWIAPILAALSVGDRLRARAMALARRAEANAVAFGGSSPSGIAAGCVWLASEQVGLGLTQAQVGEAAGVTPATLRNQVETIQGLDGVNEH